MTNVWQLLVPAIGKIDEVWPAAVEPARIDGSGEW
jgi:hypothetical protein